MARLHTEPYPGDWALRPRDDINEYLRRTQRLFDAIPRDRVIRFPVADGYACYYVHSFRPLTLQHIPQGDGYRIPAAHLRGLTESDVREMIRREQGLARLFGSR